jgi:hypothetical protein
MLSPICVGLNTAIVSVVGQISEMSGINFRHVINMICDPELFFAIYSIFIWIFERSSGFA